MAPVGKGKASRGRGGGRGGRSGARVFNGKNPSRGVGSSSHASNPSSSNATASTSKTSRATTPAQYPPSSQPPPPPRLSSPQVSGQPTNYQQPPPNYQQPPPNYQPPPPNYQPPAPYQPPGPYQIPQDQVHPHQIPQPQMPPQENPNDPPPDYQQMLENLLVLPGREHLPRLSRVPIPDVETIWFGRDKGVLSRSIAGIFRRKFDGPYYSWKVTPTAIQERYFRSFAGKFNWDIGITELVREGFLVIAKKRLKVIVSGARRTGGELGRHVSYGEVFMQTHTRADGTFVDAKAKQVAEVYNKSIEERLSELDEDGVDASDDSSQQLTHRTLTIEEKNEIFLKCTETDVKGNYFGIGSLKVTLKKGKRKESYASSSSSSITELHDQLRQKMAEHDAENARRDAEQQASQTRIANLERLVMYWKESDPAFAAFVASQPQPTAPATTAAANATATANAPATAATAQNNAEEMAGETNPATVPT